MLYFEAIDQPTLELLRKLLSVSDFKSLRLAGGTALALQLGHRKSIDLDLFGDWQVDGITIVSTMHSLGRLTILQNHPAIKTFIVDGIKVDIVNYSYPWIDELVTAENLRIAGIKDIAAMKLAAITGRGTKKDFVDVFFLLQHYSLKELLAFYEQKYADGSIFMVLKSIVYFDDAEQDADPIQLKPFIWNEIRKGILQAYKKYMEDLNE